MNIKYLVNHVNTDNIGVQSLLLSSRKIEDKKRLKRTQITFLTDVTTNEIHTGEQIGVVLWFSADDYGKACDSYIELEQRGEG